jgi:NADPH2:quinone reductase
VIAVEVSRFGEPDVLQLVERDDPAPGPGEIAIRVERCALNASDLLQRAGLYPGGPKPPFIAGQEASGIVIAHGPGVASPPIGARVSAIAATGLCAERAVVAAAACVAWPSEVSADQCAALPIALLTSCHALLDRARAAAGEVTVIHGAAGGFGSIAVQVARELGLEVIATSSPTHVSQVDADRVCSYDDLRATVPGGVDIVLDPVGGAVFRASIAILRPFGRIVVVGAASGEPQQIDAIKLVHRSHAVIGVHLRHLLERADLLSRTLATCTPWVIQGRVRARVTTLPLTDIRHAHEWLAARTVIGKLVIAVS